MAKDKSWCFRFRVSLSKLVSNRSVVRRHQYPSTKNTIHSLFLIVVSIPLASAIFPLLVLRRLSGRHLVIYTLATEGEFGPFVQLMEYLRGLKRNLVSDTRVLVLSRNRHETLEHLYENELGVKISWRRGIASIYQQALLMQPPVVLKLHRLTYMVSHRLLETPIEVSESLKELGVKTRLELGCKSSTFIAFSVHTRQYDEDFNPQYASKEASLESIGTDFIETIDYLKDRSTDLILLGSLDSGKSHIPREFPRLETFGDLGGPHEVALASSCSYFWTDYVGAWWLSVPFCRPVLFTNMARLKVRPGLVPHHHLVVPVRYRTASGAELTFRDVLNSKTAPYKLASRGDLIPMRNSSTDLIDAHREMHERLAGTWLETQEMTEARSRVKQIFREYPAVEPLNVSSLFLIRYPHLLD